MSTVLVVVIVVVVVAVVIGLLLAFLPKARERARLQKRQGELNERRGQVVDEHREEAASRERQAEIAEQRSRIAAQEAERQRAESQLAEEKARLHEQGLADHELIDNDERQRFAGTSATEPLSDEAANRRETRTEPQAPQPSRSTAYEEGQPAEDSPAPAEDFETGRRHKQRR